MVGYLFLGIRSERVWAALVAVSGIVRRFRFCAAVPAVFGATTRVARIRAWRGPELGNEDIMGNADTLGSHLSTKTRTVLALRS